jgi:hypothetical protein
MERKAKILQGIRKTCKHEPTFKIEDRLKRQIKLVVLDPKLFPESIVETFEKIKEEPLQKPRPEIGNMNMNTILQGTRYVNTKEGGMGKGNTASIFDELDKLANKKLF